MEEVTSEVDTDIDVSFDALRRGEFAELFRRGHNRESTSELDLSRGDPKCNG